MAEQLGRDPGTISRELAIQAGVVIGPSRLSL
ncbi:MAG: hypothetical protein QGH37_03160 [Candidatus Poribacteria bacterium]|nr:hypothetical protein [Candidatus Poribacteria bacterium]